MEFGKSIKHLWLLDENITFLNHGSFGATPIPVIEAAENIQRRLEREPVFFYLDDYAIEIRQTAAKLGAFVRANPDNLVFVDNATSGINTVLRSLLPKLTADDEIIITNQTYPAVKSACNYIAELTKCKIKEIKLPNIINSKFDLIDVYDIALSSKTKLLILDHIMFTTGIINPVKEIAEIAKNKGAMVLIDGAHAPGMIELNIEGLNIDWYTGNCHKWLFTPKGCAFLWTNPEHQTWTKPLSISFYHNESYTKEFDWTGTKNPVPILALNDAVDFHRGLNSDKIYDYIHNLAIEARILIADSFEFEKNCPDDLLGALASFEIPCEYKVGKEITSELRKRFFNDYKIEIPFVEFDDKIHFRLSAQVYNDLSDYEKLIEALRDFLD